MPRSPYMGLALLCQCLKRYKYAEVVNGVVQKDVELEINRRRLATAGLSEDINTNRPSTDSVYELPPGKGNFNDPATWVVIQFE